MARVTRRPLAEADILEIWGYIAEDSLAEADRWVDGLDEKLSLWATQPTMGRNRGELAPGIRSLAFGRYVVFFQPLPDGIDVVRVLHGSRDIDASFEL
ncbi:type II toxin-antitoxin system RelE/ParE family toxin [Roseateles sp. P5_E1]|jgi:toxin ParE1/3/4